MHNLGLFIWILFILIGVISNIRKSVKKAAADKPTVSTPKAAAAPRPAVPIAKALATTQSPSVMQTVMTQKQAETASPLFSAPEPVIPVPAAAVDQPVVVAKVVKPAPVAPPRTSALDEGDVRRIPGILANRGSIVRAVIAQQVLGPPLALAEQSIWNQR